MGVVNYWTEHWMSCHVMLCESILELFDVSAITVTFALSKSYIQFAFCMDGKFSENIISIRQCGYFFMIFISYKFSKQTESFWFKSTKNERTHFFSCSHRFAYSKQEKKKHIGDFISSNDSNPCQHIFLVNCLMFSIVDFITHQWNENTHLTKTYQHWKIN